MVWRLCLFGLMFVFIVISASGLLGASSYGIAMPKHYPYVRNISVAVLQLHENGELDSLWRKWWDNRSQCPKEQKRSGSIDDKKIIM